MGRTTGVCGEPEPIVLEVLADLAFGSPSNVDLYMCRIRVQSESRNAHPLRRCAVHKFDRGLSSCQWRYCILHYLASTFQAETYLKSDACRERESSEVVGDLLAPYVTGEQTTF